MRATSAAILLIGDGDMAGVIHTTDLKEIGIDVYLGTGDAPEDVLAAAALSCTGGQMLGCLLIDSPEKVARLAIVRYHQPQEGLPLRRNGTWRCVALCLLA